METIHGYIDHIIYQRADNGYTVLDFIFEGEEITCVGNLGQVSPGENLELQGEFVSHPTYGEQFSVASFRETAPESAEAIELNLFTKQKKGHRCREKRMDAKGDKRGWDELGGWD